MLAQKSVDPKTKSVENPLENPLAGAENDRALNPKTESVENPLAGATCSHCCDAGEPKRLSAVCWQPSGLVPLPRDLEYK